MCNDPNRIHCVLSIFKHWRRNENARKEYFKNISIQKFYINNTFHVYKSYALRAILYLAKNSAKYQNIFFDHCYEFKGRLKDRTDNQWAFNKNATRLRNIVTQCVNSDWRAIHKYWIHTSCHSYRIIAIIHGELSEMNDSGKFQQKI